MIPTRVPLESLLLEIPSMLDLLVQLRHVVFRSTHRHRSPPSRAILLIAIGINSPVRRSRSVSPAIAQLHKLLQGESVDRSINASLTDQEVVVDDRHVVLGQLDIELDIGRAQVRGGDKRLDCVLTQLQRFAAGKVLTQTAVADDHGRA